MNPLCHIQAPFFEIGPKSYLYGNDILELAKAADDTSEKYHVDIIFTTPFVEIARVKAITKHLHLFAPHMDPLFPGRGIADILPESLVAVGAEGVMLNHAEKPLSINVLHKTIMRADEVGLSTIVCSNSITEAEMVAKLNPNIIVAEPTELIGTGITCGNEYAQAAIHTIKKVNPNILVLLGAGISNGSDVYNAMLSGADATGSSSGIINASDRIAMMEEMVSSVRLAWDKKHKTII